MPDSLEDDRVLDPGLVQDEVLPGSRLLVGRPPLVDEIGHAVPRSCRRIGPRVSSNPVANRHRISLDRSRRQTPESLGSLDARRPCCHSFDCRRTVSRSLRLLIRCPWLAVRVHCHRTSGSHISATSWTVTLDCAPTAWSLLSSDESDAAGRSRHGSFDPAQRSAPLWKLALAAPCGLSPVTQAEGPVMIRMRNSAVARMERFREVKRAHANG